MSEGSRWTPMNERTNSRMFGIYREPDPGRHASARINFKLVLLIVVLAASTLSVFLVSLRLSRTEEGIDVAERREEVEGVTLILPTVKTIASWINATDGTQDRVQDTLGRPYPAEVLTETYSGTQGERAVVLEATTLGQQQNRRARAYNEELTEARIVNRPRFPDRDLATSYSQPPIFSEQYAQLEGYRKPIRGLQDVMSWVEKPGVKFSGVYFKDDESRPYLNGHAYVSDPFVRFKPSHPAEINQLAVEADRGPRFSNRPSGDPHSTGSSHTQAIFHPYTPLRPRPLKIMLDIYPMIPEPPIGSLQSEIVADPRGRRSRFTPPNNSKRMIVQLNLYPKKNPRFSRRLPPLTEETMQQRMFDGLAQAEEEQSEQTTTELSMDETTTTTAVNVKE